MRKLKNKTIRVKNVNALKLGMNPKGDDRTNEPRPVSKNEPVRIFVQSLFAGRSEIILVHNDEDYRLRITSRGKLILTK